MEPENLDLVCGACGRRGGVDITAIRRQLEGQPPAARVIIECGCGFYQFALGLRKPVANVGDSDVRLSKTEAAAPPQ